MIQQTALKALEVQLSIKPANKAAALETIYSLALQITCEYILDTIQSKEAGRASLRALSSRSGTELQNLFSSTAVDSPQA